MLSWVRIWDGVRATGHALFYVIMASVCAVFVVIGVIELVGRDRPTHWGTFSETSTVCDLPSPRGSTCTYTGTWVSDDGSIVKTDITLDGSVDPGQSVRASYQPGGPMGDDVNNIVHTALWSKVGLWFPWAAAVSFATITWYQHRRWRRESRGRRYRGRHSASDPSSHPSSLDNRIPEVDQGAMGNEGGTIPPHVDR